MDCRAYYLLGFNFFFYYTKSKSKTGNWTCMRDACEIVVHYVLACISCLPTQICQHGCLVTQYIFPRSKVEASNCVNDPNSDT